MAEETNAHLQNHHLRSMASGESANLRAPDMEPFIQDWLQCVHETIARERKVLKDGNNDKEEGIPYMAVPTPVVKLIFIVAGHFGLEPSTRYLTVHLYDKFMRKYIHGIYNAELRENGTEEAWVQIKKNIASQAKLRLMSCIQLASKIDSHSKGLSIPQVMQTLQWLDNTFEYTKTSILHSEFKVYETIDFKIPLFTPLHCVELLLAITRLEQVSEAYEICINLLDLAYLQHERLYSQFHLVIRGRYPQSHKDRQSIMVMESNVLYLGAVIVLCSVFCLSIGASDTKRLLVKLSDLIEITEEDIWVMAKLLFTLAIEDHT